MRKLVLSGVILIAWSAAALAQDLGVASLSALPPAAAPCANCHGTDGLGQGAIPAIGGRPAEVLAQKLREYRGDQPPADATVMPRLIKGLSETEIDTVAQYFSTVH